MKKRKALRLYRRGCLLKNKRAIVIIGMFITILLMMWMIFTKTSAIGVEAIGTERDVEDEKKLIRLCARDCITESSSREIKASTILNKMIKYGGDNIVTTKEETDTIVITYTNSGREYLIYKNSTEVYGRTIIIFDANGGEVTPKSKIATVGLKYGELPIPTREGYTFNGWYTEKDGGTQKTNESIYEFNGTSTLYAHWTVNTYTVTFNGNGGNPTQGSKTVTYAGTYGSLPTASRAGYSFAGWYTTASGGSKIETSTQYTTAGNTTLYAHWNAITYTVSFNGNGGSVSQGSKTVTYDGTYGSLPTASRAGYSFAGWYTTAGGGSKIETSTKYTTAGNTTLYAHWTQSDYTAPTISRTSVNPGLIGTANPLFQVTYYVNDTGGAGTAAYYWGTSVPNANSSWNSFSGGGSITVQFSVTYKLYQEQSGVWYFGAKDNCGNINYTEFKWKVLWHDNPSSSYRSLVDINTSGYNYWSCGENHWSTILISDAGYNEITRFTANSGASGTVDGRSLMKVGWAGFCFSCWN